MNGRRLTLTNDNAYDLVMVVAAGTLDDINNIADQLAKQPSRANGRQIRPYQQAFGRGSRYRPGSG